MYNISQNALQWYKPNLIGKWSWVVSHSGCPSTGSPLCCPCRHRCSNNSEGPNFVANGRNSWNVQTSRTSHFLLVTCWTEWTKCCGLCYLWMFKSFFSFFHNYMIQIYLYDVKWGQKPKTPSNHSSIFFLLPSSGLLWTNCTPVTLGYTLFVHCLHCFVVIFLFDVVTSSSVSLWSFHISNHWIDFFLHCIATGHEKHLIHIMSCSFIEVLRAFTW